MARDYKDRANQKKRKGQVAFVAWWKWCLIIVLIALFVLFLVFLGDSSPEVKENQKTKNISVSKKPSKPVVAKHQNTKSKEPHFDFYTILPETEVIVPDYEIKTRSREEQFGKGKSTKYIMQVGAFRDFSEADKLRARLAFLGIESRVEKAKIGRVIWNRVKMGPFSRPSNVSTLKDKLSLNNIDVIVTEIK